VAEVLDLSQVGHHQVDLAAEVQYHQVLLATPQDKAVVVLLTLAEAALPHVD
jgi:hypothetical protein